MADTIEDLLSELESEDDGYDLTFGRARSRAAAEAYAKPVDLVVTAVEIPADNNSPLPAGERRRLGMELFRTLHTKKPEIGAIFVTDHVDDAIDSFSRTEHVPLAPEGENFRENLRLAASQVLGPPRPRRAILTITLGKDHCSYEFQSEGAKRGSRYPLVIDADQLNELVEESRSVHVKDGTWPGALQRLGESSPNGCSAGPLQTWSFATRSTNG